MQEGMKIGAAALGGYVLGRTKKAKAAVGLALWLGGKRHLGEFARNELVNIAQSEHGKEIAGVGRQAVVALVEKQAGRLGDAMQKRAEALEPERLTKRRPPRRSVEDEDEDDYDDDSEEYEDDEQEDDDDSEEYEDEYDDDAEEDDSEEDDSEEDDSEEYEDEYDDEYDDDEYDDGESEYEDEDEDQGERELVGARRRR